ncbi:MAG: M48 family metallopeptidase [Tannerellaceae bacterium]|nr:M48 family metallopeptidase [Tannerellaceae bacterium]MCD8263178.1 M48 family metallopeptidase [Tannerellaceae bacterium]
MRTVVILWVMMAGMTLPAHAQLKVGNKTINTKKVVNAAADVASAITLSDADITEMSREYIEWMDANNPVAGTDTELGARLERLTQDLKQTGGMDLNFKVYYVVDVNAFACGDGSIRVCGGLLEVMDDAEVLAVIGHEIGHVVNTDVKDAMKNAYLTSAAKNAAGATGGVAEKLSDSQLGDLAQVLSGAQFSQKQENAADDYAFEFCIANEIDPYAMSNALNKLVELSSGRGEKASRVSQMFSTHPDSEKRAKRMKEKADRYRVNN